ncbi:hypothetical protein BpHYR1_019604 [Brachionus plicatilis]|uniref:Uncharacterized protein n=1 Tax=Brachionus plicatilis TaxID=10195 RepID=A0A3M7P1Q6_BRAPC|nr:hypothetical protein BpHYR1_019604 [Brachionus plicatilis]
MIKLLIYSVHCIKSPSTIYNLKQNMKNNKKWQQINTIPQASVENMQLVNKKKSRNNKPCTSSIHITKIPTKIDYHDFIDNPMP